jgi:hypothetical protein
MILPQQLLIIIFFYHHRHFSILVNLGNNTGLPIQHHSPPGGRLPHFKTRRMPVRAQRSAPTFKSSICNHKSYHPADSRFINRMGNSIFGTTAFLFLIRFISKSTVIEASSGDLRSTLAIGGAKY